MALMNAHTVLATSLTFFPLNPILFYDVDVAVTLQRRKSLGSQRLSNCRMHCLFLSEEKVEMGGRFSSFSDI